MPIKALAKTRPIFISCSTIDINIARYLRDAIDQLPTYWGFIARDEPRPFVYPSEKIAEILELCSAYLILYTSEAFRSPMVNQEFGFFYHRYRIGRKNYPPIILLKSEDITGQIDGFAYAREAISFNPRNMRSAICDVLWEFKNKLKINYLEIKCGNHITKQLWPPIELCREALNENKNLELTCDTCGSKIEMDSYTFLPV